MNEELTYEQAVEMLPEGDTIHSFAGGGGMMLGCDHSRESILQTLRDAEALRLAGPVAEGLGHGLAVKRPERGWLFVETRKEVA